MILTMLMIINLLTTITFVFIKHPMSMGMILLIQTTLIALITGFFNLNFWFSYVLFLIMVGGMLILFIYMTSIASNEMFNYSNKIFWLITLSMISMLTMIFIDQFFFLESMENTDFSSVKKFSMFNLSMNKYLNFPSSNIFMFMVIYLFMTLVAVVKISKLSNGPLRTK